MALPPSIRGLAPWLAAAFVAAAALLGIARSLAAQEPAPPPPLSGETKPEAATGIPGGVEIELERFGAGDVVRPGEWAAIRVALRDLGAKPRAVIVRVITKDDDGDQPSYQRRITVNPGRAQATWLFVRMPWNLERSSIFSIAANELNEDADPLTPGAVGRLLGLRRVSPAAVAAAERSMIGVIGSATLGLSQYALRGPGAGEDYLTSHEAAELVTGLTARSMPDSWEGLAGFEAILWSGNIGGGGDTSVDPSNFDDENVRRALVEWVARGGHLIVVLPPVGSTFFAGSNPLRDALMPRAEPERLEGASLEPYRQWLTTPAYDARPLPEKAVVHRFRIAEGTSPTDASPIIAGPDGVVAVRRLVGTGMVTVVGLDLSDKSLTEGGILRAESFWHRILGKRFDSRPPAANAGAGNQNFSSPRGSLWADRLIGGEINMGAAAGVGVLLALVVFIVYWLIAGPVGFGLLRSRGWTRHSWLFFVGSSLVFALIGWIGASALKPQTIQVRHLTVLDHVYGQPNQRARTWASVLLPQYGSEFIRVGEPGADAAFRQTLSPWSDPAREASALMFTDARPYAIDRAEPWQSVVPARATVKTFQFDWAGGPRWTLIQPMDPASPPRLVGGELAGAVFHRLPAPLEDVTIILVAGQTAPSAGAPSGALRARAYAWSLPNPWAPGETSAINLGDREAFRLPPAAAGRFLANLVPSAPRFGLGEVPDVSGRVAHELIALYGMLEPPDYRGPAGSERVRVQRRATHGLDLARWFTQPCLIIIGSIPGPAPTPLFRMTTPTRGEPLPTSGRTIVRWVYPLEGGQTPVFQPVAAPADGRAERSAEPPSKAPPTPGAAPAAPFRKPRP
ncbi:MAG: hypothetical protein IBJ11_00665 [Phycisphaerales bacterium]|nr:hypothetical protein [Phycisphaerales bacterium]